MATLRRALAFALALALASAAPAPTPGVSYDQRQFGDYNINLDVRNVEVVAVLGNYGSYEYEDYEDPQEPSDAPLQRPTSTEAAPAPGFANTSVPTSTADSANTSAPADASASADSSVPSSTAAPASTGAPAAAAAQADAGAVTAAPDASTASPGRRKCGAGLFRDRLGRCRRVPAPAAAAAALDWPFGFRVAPKLRRERQPAAS